MNGLAALQREFATRVLSGGEAAAFAAAVVATDAADSDSRLHVYEHAYRARLVEVLGNDFPYLRRLAGEETFSRLAHAYVATTRSRHFNIRWYGERLTAFLRASTPWSETPGFGDMAALEWTIGLCFDAEDEDYVDVHDVATLPPEQWATLRMRLRVAVQRVDLNWNVGEIRRAIDDQQAIPQLRRLESPEAWIVSRPDDVVRYRRMDGDEAAALDAARRGASFAELCDLLCKWHESDEVAGRVAMLFKAWIENRWIAELVLEPD